MDDSIGGPNACNAIFKGQFPLRLSRKNICEYFWTLNVSDWSHVSVGVESVYTLDGATEQLYSPKFRVWGSVAVRLIIRKSFDNKERISFSIRNGPKAFDPPGWNLNEERKEKTYQLVLEVWGKDSDIPMGSINLTRFAIKSQD